MNKRNLKEVSILVSLMVSLVWVGPAVAFDKTGLTPQERLGKVLSFDACDACVFRAIRPVIPG